MQHGTSSGPKGNTPLKGRIVSHGGRGERIKGGGRSAT